MGGLLWRRPGGGGCTPVCPLLQDLPGSRGRVARLGNTEQGLEAETPTRGGRTSRAPRGDTPSAGRLTAGTKGRHPAALTRGPEARGRPANRRAAFPPRGRGPIGSRARPHRGDTANQLRGRARGRIRAEFQTGRVGAERPCGACGRRWRLLGECSPGTRWPFRSHGTWTGAHAGPSGDCKTQIGGLRGGSALGPGEFAKGPRMGHRPSGARRGPVLTLPASPLEAESRKEAGRKDSCGRHWQRGPQDTRSGLSIPRSLWASLTPLPGSTLLPALTAAKGLHAQPSLPVCLGPVEGREDALLTCLLTSPGSGGLSRLLTRQMASKWPGVGASVRRTSLQDQEQLEDEVLQPAAGHPETSCGALGSLCRQFQRRLPLRAVSLNLGARPSWKRLESPESGQQGLQAAARSAKNALGAVSQVRPAMSRVP